MRRPARVSDAIPLLEKAKKVRVVTVLNEKNLDRKHSAEELSKNLSRHGIDVVLDKVDAKDGRSATFSTLMSLPTRWTCSSWVRMGTLVCANLSWAARPIACCRNRHTDPILALMIEIRP